MDAVPAAGYEGSVTTRDVIVVGASAGGVEALARFVGALPRELSAAVLVVLHVSRASALPAILARSTGLTVRHPGGPEPLSHGTVYVGPPEHHLVVRPQERVGNGADEGPGERDGDREPVVDVSAGPRENGYRPSVDVLFRTAARSLGPRVVAVVLSGALDDGVAGAAAVRARGGLVFTQAAEDCLHPSMPESTRLRVGADGTGTAEDLARLVAAHADDGGDPAALPEDALLDREADVGEDIHDSVLADDHVGPPSGYSCPDCAGALYSVSDPVVLRFRCRVGHAWTASSLAVEQDESTETALWIAVRALEERSELSRRLAVTAQAEGRSMTSEQFRRSAERADRSARRVKELLDTVVRGREHDLAVIREATGE